MTTALIVDDHEQNLYLLQTLLEGYGYTVMQARNGSEALELARHNPPNIVISDIFMPVMDGFALCREWKKDERLQNIPFVFYTATYTDPKDEDLGLSLGAARFIIKPTEPEAFVVILQQVIQEHATGELVAPRQPVQEETVYYRLYNEALVRKLEDKMLELEQVNRALEQDIAERKQAEEALRASEERYRSLFENSDDAILLTAPDGRIFAANPAACRIVGRTEAEICQTGRAGVVDPTDPRLPIALEERERTGRFRGELTCLRSDGQPFPGEVTSVVFQGEGGQPRTSMIIRDITERKQAEEALRQSREKEQFLADLVENADQPIGVGYPDGRLGICNRAFCELTGYSAEELRTLDWSTVLTPPEWIEPEWKALLELERTGRPVRYQKEYIRKDGRRVPIELLAHAIRDGSGQVQYYYAFVTDITERKRAEKALEESEARYRNLVEEASIGIVVTVGFTVVFCNQREIQLFGYKAPSDMQGHAISEFVKQEDLQELAVLGESIGSGKSMESLITFQGVRPDGRELVIEARAIPFSYEGNEALLSFHSDITERKRAEEALRHSEAFLDSIIEHSPHAMWISDDKGTLIRLNQACRDLLHVRDDEVMGKYNVLQDNIVEEQGLLPLVRQVFEKRETVKFTLRYDSSQLKHLELTETAFLILDVTISPVLDATGRVTNAIIQHIDITERQRAEEALKESEVKYRRLHESMSDAFVSTDMSGRIQEFNRAYRDMLGYSDEELLRLTNVDLTPEKWHAFEAGIVEGQILKRGSSDVYEKEYQRKDGTVFPVELRTFLIQDGSGRPLAMWAIVRDITERKRAEAALRESEDRYRDLVEHSHDLICTHDVQGQILSANPAATKLLGIDPDVLVKMNLRDILAPEVRDQFAEYLDTIQTDGIASGLMLVQTRAGERRLWEYDNTLRTQGVAAPVVRGMARDITERKQMEEALRDKVIALQTLAEIDREVIAATQSQGVLELVCRRAAELVRARKSAIVIETSPGEMRMTANHGLIDPARSGEEFARSPMGSEQYQDILKARGVLAYDEIPADVPHMPEFRAREGILAQAIMPLIVGEQVQGALMVFDTAPRAWSADELQVLSLLAGQAAIALDKARLFEETRTRAEQLALLYAVGQAINSTLDSDTILDRLTDEAMRATHATHGSALISLPDLGRFERRSLRGYSPEQTEKARNIPLPLNRGVNSRAYQTRQVAYLSDVQTDPDYFPLIPETRSELAVPIMRGGRVLGDLDLQSPERDAFRDVDLGFLQALTDQVAIALENARLFEVERRRLEELSIISDVALAGATGQPFDETVARATQNLSRLWPEADCGFLFLDEADQSLHVHPSYHGLQPESIASVRIPLSQGLTGWAARERQPVRVGDVTADPRYACVVDNVRSEMAAPLIADDHVIGVVNIYSHRLNAFSQDDLLLLTTLAGQLATIFEKARLDTALEEERTSLAQRVEERTAELNIVNAELRQAARAKDEFLASMSHELRTPLNAILGISEALQEQVFGPLNEKQLRYVHTIEESGQHLLALINDILDLSKVEAGKVELQISRVAVESVCQASLQFIKEAAHRKHVIVSSSLDSRVSTMQADERRLKQILVNLLSNAVKFTPEGGEIGLQMLGDAERQRVHFIVWDTGIGIAREDIGRLFQPFVQLDSSLSRQYSGTGLGLSLVKRLAELHGGSVSVESQVGKGSRFTVSLPWRAVSEEKRVASDEERVGKEGALDARPAASVAVLLVEDSETNLTAMSDYLSAKGYRVIVARNGSEAIRRAGEDRPDVVLMDIQMPGMDGLEAIRHIRAEPDPRVAHVPIIALTAIAMSGDRQRCIEAGANEYLSKPVSLKELVEVIEAQLREV